MANWFPSSRYATPMEFVCHSPANRFRMSLPVPGPEPNLRRSPGYLHGGNLFVPCGLISYMCWAALADQRAFQSIWVRVMTGVGRMLRRFGLGGSNGRRRRSDSQQSSTPGLAPATSRAEVIFRTSGTHAAGRKCSASAALVGCGDHIEIAGSDGTRKSDLATAVPRCGRRAA